MKKALLLIITIILILIFSVNATSCNLSNIKIKSICLTKTTGSAEEIKEAKVEEKNKS